MPDTSVCGGEVCIEGSVHSGLAPSQGSMAEGQGRAEIAHGVEVEAERYQGREERK